MLLFPQLFEQWKLKSAEGIAIGTVLIWFFGDLANLYGAVLGKLLPSVILLAIWFVVCDGSLLASYIYYKYIYPRRHRVIHHHLDLHGNEVSETTNLLSDDQELVLHPRTLSNKSTKFTIEKPSVFYQYVLPVLFVFASGIVGYIISSNSAAPPSVPGDDVPIMPEPVNLVSQIFGYISAVCYLGARIPQIIYNYKRKSVYGLSLLFVLFSCFGNLTYCLQIVLYRSDWDYLVLNGPWLIGGFGTIFEDAYLLVQFFIYRDDSTEVIEIIE